MAPAEELVEAPAQEPEQPDAKGLFSSLPPEEQQAFLKEQSWYQETVRDAEHRGEQAGESRAYNRHMDDIQRQARANQTIASALQNLASATDENQQAQVLQGVASAAIQDFAAQRDSQWQGFLDSSFRQLFKMNEAEYRMAWQPVHEKAAKENRVANYADFLAHITGEKFMSKQALSKDMEDEIKAQVEEAVGKRLVSQPAPVVLGPGAAGPGGLTPERYKALSDEERAKLSPDQIDTMTRKYLE